MIRRTIPLLLIAALFALSACSSGGSSDEQDVVGQPDGTADGQVADDTAQDAADDAAADDTGTPDGVDGPTLECWLETEPGRVALSDGVTLSWTDEPLAYRDVNGFQLDVGAAFARAADADELEVYVDEVRLAGIALTPDGTGAGEATVSQVTLPHAPHGAAVEVRLLVADAPVATCRARVTVDLGTCPVELLPAAESCLSADESDAIGFQRRFTVRSQGGGCDEAWLEYQTDGALLPVPVTRLDENGEAEFELQLFPTSAALNNERLIVIAHVDDSGNAARRGSTAPVTYNIDNTPPSVTIVNPTSGQVTLADDWDGQPSNGLQLRVSGRAAGVVPSDGAAVRLFLDGEELGSTTVDESGEFAFAPYGFQQSGTYALTVTADDTCGGHGEASLVLDVQTVQPELAIVSPTGVAPLLAVDDGDRDTALDYETTFQVRHNSVPAGTTLTARCRRASATGSPAVEVGMATVARAEDTETPIAVVLPVGTLGNEQACSVVADTTPLVQSAEVELLVGLPRPLLRLDVPLDDAYVAAGQSSLSLAGAAENLAGRPLEITLFDADDALLSVSVVDDAILATAFGAALPLELAGVPLADGAYTVAVDASDAWGNRAQDQLDADGVPTRTRAAFRIDRTAPGVTFVAPPEGTLNPLEDDAWADADAATPGHQIPVTLELTDAPRVLPGGEVCLAVNGVEQGCLSVPFDGDTAQPVVFPSVTLQPGSNTLVASGRDAAGNEAAAATRTVSLALDAPRVVIVEPAAGSFTAEAAIEFVIDVRDRDDTGPLAGADVALLMNGAESGVAAVDQGDGRYLFAGVALRAGANTAQARANAGGTDGFSLPITVTYKTEAPTLSFSTPLPDDVINLASALCAPGTVDCAATVALRAEAIEDGSGATLTVDCGAGESELSADVEGGRVEFTDTPLLHGATCTLTARATDALGQEAQAGPISVRVDRVAPVLGALVLPETLLYDDDADPDTPGLQTLVVIDAGGAEAGQQIVLRAENAFGDAETHTVTLENDIPDGQSESISFGAVTLPGGFLEVTADLADAAANPAETARASAYVDPDFPEVRILDPADIPPGTCETSADCAPGGVCGADGCGRPWGAASNLSVSMALQGIAAGSANARVCSDHPSFTDAPACATAGGYHEVVRADVTGEELRVSLEGLLPEGYLSFVVEAETIPGSGDWVSSVDAGADFYRSRVVYVDTIAPSVTGVDSPSDVETPVGVLNLIEQSAEGRRYVLRVRADEDGTARLFINGTEGAEFPVVGGEGQLEVVLLEGMNTVQARIEDLVGNPSSLGPDPAIDLRVDTVAPTLEFRYPDRTPILAGAPLDVVLESDAVGRTVSLFDGPPDTAVQQGLALVEADGLATFRHDIVGALSDGDHQLSAIVRDAANNPATAVTSPVLVQVDTVPPTLAVSAPTAQAAFTDADDAAPATGGFQLLATFVPGGAATWAVDLSGGCDATFQGCNEPIALSDGAADGSEVSLTLTVPVDAELTYHVLGIETRDELGNVVREEIPFSVELSNCVVSLTGLPAGGVFSNESCAADPGSDCDSVDTSVAVQFTPACVGADTVALYKDGVQFATTQDIVDERAEFAFTLAHGEVFGLSARTLAGATSVGDSGETPVRVDLRDPVPTFVAADVDGFTTAASGDSALYGIGDDQQPGTATSAEIHVRLSVTDDGGLAGGEVLALIADGPGGATPLVPSNATLPVAIDGAPFTVDLKDLTFADGGPYTLIVTVSDGVGNTAATQFDLTVDLVPPPAVDLEAIAAVDVDPRRPSVTLRWTAVPEDPGAAEAAAAYDIRYARQPITDLDRFEVACRAEDLVPGLPYPTPAAPGSAESFTVDGPDARDIDDPCRFVTSLEARELYFAVRALDAAGNPSALGVGQSTADVHLRYAAITPTNNTAGTMFHDQSEIDRRVYPVGDLDGDGIDDMAFGGVWSHTVCILYGHGDGAAATFADYAMDGTTGDEHQCLGDTDATGLGTIVAGPLDVNGDGIHDLVVGKGSNDPWTGPFPAEVAIYLGRSGQRLAETPNVTLTGFTTFQYIGLQVASAGNFNGDSVAGRPIDDIIVASDFEGPSGAETGAAYVIPGDATWDVDTALTIDVADPTDREAFDVARIAVVGTIPVEDDGTYVPPLFAYRVAAAGDILADEGGASYGDVLVVQRVHKRAIYLIKGRPLEGAVDIFVTDEASIPDPATGEDANVVRLQPEFGINTNSFGTTVFGGVDLNGGGVPDIVVAHPSAVAEHGNNIHVFWGESLVDRGGRYVRVSLYDPVQTVGDMLLGRNGVILQGAYQKPALLGDFDDEGGASADLAYVLNTPPDFGEVHVRLNLALPEVDDSHGHFPYLDLLLEDPTGGGSTCFGSQVAGVGDVNGDGLPDLLVGGNGCGTAYLIY